MVILNTVPLLLTKVQPPAGRPDGLRRAHLLDALLAHADRKLLLIVAPAGYGKTTLLVDLVDCAPLPVAWLTLDGTDGDPRSFLEYLIGAVQRLYPAFGAATHALLSAMSEMNGHMTALARTFAAEVQQHVTGVSLLVLDDFHEVNESHAVTAFIDELLRLLPDNLRLVLAGRSIPKLTVSRLAVEQQLFGLGETDLRFGAEEVVELFRIRYKVELTRDQATTLTERAEGWITGLLLSMQGIWNGLIDRLIDTPGLHGGVYTYLADEVLNRQPPALCEFVVASSVLDVVDPASCAELLGPGDWLALLQQAERANLFITRLGGSAITFRFHQMFRDFLQARLRRDRPEQYRALHSCAARHCAAHRDWAAALGHLSEAGEDGERAALLERIAPDLEQEGRWYLLAHAIDALPEGLRTQSATLLLARARAAALSGDPRRAEALARQALALAQGERAVHTRAWALQVLGNALRRLGRTDEAVAALATARQLAADDERLLATVRRDLAGCHGVRGDFADAAAELREALSYFERCGNAYEAARAAFGLGTALGRTGDVSQAIAQYEYALARFRTAGDGGSAALTLNNLGYLLLLHGSYAQAERVLGEALGSAREAAHLPAEAQAWDSLGALYLSRGDAAGATDAFTRGLAAAEAAGELWSMSATTEGLGFCALLRGELTTAEQCFERAASLAEQQQSHYRAALVEVGRGVLCLQSGDDERALAAFTAAVERFSQLGSRRDVARTCAWLAHAHWRRADRRAASLCFQRAAAEVASLRLPGLLDLPARWNAAAFAAFPAGEFASLQDDVLRRVSSAPVPAAEPPGDVGPAAARFAAYSFAGGQVLGPQGTEVQWGREKARELFFYLLHRGPIRSDRMLADLWPTSSPGHARASLYSAAYALRRATHACVLVVVGQTYSLNSQTIAYHDAAEFDVLETRLRREADPDRRLAIMEQIARVYSGPFLKGLDPEWAEEFRRTYEVRAVDVIRLLVAARAARGAWRTCLAAALDGLKVDPYCESFYAYATRSYLALGDQDAARRMYREGRHRLEELFGP